MGIQSKVKAVATTKLAPRDRDDGHVVRRDLLDLLDEVLRHRLTIVHAGAGYGKTSLLIQWFKAIKRRRIAAAWLTLEEDEAVPSTCLAHIITALNRLGYIEYDVLSKSSQFDDKMPVKSLATVFVNIVVEKKQPLVIFLDEYNRAQSDETDALLRTLIRNMPRHVHFVIASRWRPEIDIENLRARDDLVEISAQHLRFSQQEVAELLASSGLHLSGVELHRLTDRTEGWPIALQMARLWLNGDDMRAHVVSDFSGRTTDLARYLTEQVLSELPDEQRSFLMHTAILDRVNGDIANAVTGRRDGWLMLEQLCERNLFLVPDSDDRQWFHYHTLFLDFLRDGLQRYLAEAVPELHHRAADWLAAHGMVKPAVYHALKAGDQDLAAVILSAAGGWRLIMDGRIKLIRTGVDSLPDAIIRKHPPLALAKAFLLVKGGDIKVAREYFSGLESEATEAWNAHDRTDWQIVKNIIADYADDPVSTAELEDLQLLRRQVSKHDHVIQAVLADSLATKYYEFRLFKQALETCDDAISHYRVLRSLYGEVFLRFTQAKAHLAQGRLDDAEAILRQTDKELEVRFGEGVDLSAHTSIYLAELLIERYLIDEASIRLDQALPVAEQSDGWFELYGAAYTAAAAVAWATGGMDAALAVLDRGRSIAVARCLDRLDLLADCESVYYLCLSGRIGQARRYVPRLQQVVENSATRPCHWLVSTVAARLAMIYIAEGKYADADGLLAPNIETAERNGDLRQLIALNLLLADSRASSGRTKDAARLLDKAVHDGLFTGLKRIYVDHGRRLMPVIDLILRDRSGLPADRYRDAFLRELRREIRRAEKRQTGDGIVLTPGELEVLQELDHGHSNKEIARRIGVSPNTVKYRVKSLFSKLGVTVRTEAVRLSRERSLLSTGDPKA
jgi:LuxR family maltose regulon positive regulatory protein